MIAESLAEMTAEKVITTRGGCTFLSNPNRSRNKRGRTLALLNADPSLDEQLGEGVGGWGGGSSNYFVF